jgi:5-hydroxyisourate hydrolase-like protein (transthyretin family)
MRRSTPIVACLMMALSSSAPPAVQAAKPVATNFRISGTVVDAGSGSPLAKTTVLLASVLGNRTPIASVTTGADGRFEFDHLVAGKYSLLAQRHGYLTEALDQHDNYWTAVAVGPDLVSDAIIYRLHPDASLSGRALDEVNEPVRSAQVMLFADINNGREKMPQVRSSQTDDQGVFRFPHLPPGTYVIAVSAQPWYAQHPIPSMRARTSDGTPEFVEPTPSPLDVTYPLTFYSGATDARSATPISLSAGEHVTADVTLRAIPALRLRVHTALGHDTPGEAQISVNCSIRQRLFGTDVYLPTTARSSTPGVTEFAGLAPGRYEVSVTVNDRGSRTESRQEIDLVTDSDMEGTQNAVALATVAGTLHVAGAEPAKDPPPFSVLLRDLNSGQASSAPVNADGKFEFGQNLAPGKYRILLAGQNAYLRSVSATRARVSGRNLLIGSGPVKLTLVASLGVGTVDGIAFRDGKPQPGAMVVLVPENPRGEELFRRDQSDSDGSFTLPSVVPGKYVVIALASWDIPWQDPETLRGYMLHGQAIDVQPRGKYQVKVQVQ